MKVFLIQAVRFANGVPCPHSWQFLKSFDFEHEDGLGYGTFTKDPNKAMRFVNAAEAMQFWNTQSTVRPLREDGKPNKPLTALTIAIESHEV